MNVLTPPDLASGTVQVQVTTKAGTSAVFAAQTQAEAPSFFIFGAGPYVVATHANGSLIGPTSLYPGSSTPAAPGETITLYANGFGPTSIPAIKGSETQSGDLTPLPSVTIGKASAAVQFAGLISPGLFQFNVVVPASTPGGDNALTATFGGFTTQSGVLLTVQSLTPEVQSLTLSASQIAGGGSVQGTVTLTGAAPSGGAVVALSSNSAAATVPATVSIPAGSTSASFTVSSSAVTSNQSVAITATYGGNSGQAVLQVNAPAAPSSFTLLELTVTFQPSGSASFATIIQVTPNAGGSSYSAELSGGTFLHQRNRLESGPDVHV